MNTGTSSESSLSRVGKSPLPQGGEGLWLCVQQLEIKRAGRGQSEGASQNLAVVGSW